MRNRSQVLILAAMVSLGHFAAATGLNAQGAISIRLNPKYIFSGDTRVIEVFDVHCNTSKGQHSITGGGSSVSVSVCTSSAGYGRIRYRNVTNNGGWVESALLSNGDDVYP